MKCTAPRYQGDDLRELWKRALERCEREARWKTAMGPRCDQCVRRDEDAIQPGAPTLIAMLMDERRVPAKKGRRELKKEPIQ